MSPIVPPRSSEESRPHVVVGVDGSAGSRAALTQAWLRAARSGAGLEAGVQALGLDKAAIAAALRSPDIDTHIRRDFMGGVRSGVNGTPSFYVNGELHQGDFDSLTHGIGRLIARQA